MSNHSGLWYRERRGYTVQVYHDLDDDAIWVSIASRTLSVRFQLMTSTEFGAFIRKMGEWYG